MGVRKPNMDGHENHQGNSRSGEDDGEHSPIIAMTAQSRRVNAQQCLAAGMDGYVAKPIQMGELRATIENMLGKRRLTRLASRFQTSLRRELICLLS
jgi:CheY-like chemotaxis protein